MNEVALVSEGAVSYVDPFINMIDRFVRDPAADIDKLDRMLQLREREMDRQAERSFNRALAAAQAEIAPVVVDSKNQQTRSQYASYAALDRAVRPIYAKHGFGLTFNTAETPITDQIRIVCDVCHGEGHTRRYQIDMPADGKGARGGDVMTKTHATGSAVSYGMRYLLKMIFNLATDTDDDGNSASAPRNQAPAQAQQQRKPPPPAANPMRQPESTPQAIATPPIDPSRRAIIAEPGKPAYWSDTGEIVDNTATAHDVGQAMREGRPASPDDDIPGFLDRRPSATATQQPQDETPTEDVQAAKAAAYIKLAKAVIAREMNHSQLVSWWNKTGKPWCYENFLTQEEVDELQRLVIERRDFLKKKNAIAPPV